VYENAEFVVNRSKLCMPPLLVFTGLDSNARDGEGKAADPGCHSMCHDIQHVC
jgi:hypothetical protein